MTLSPSPPPLRTSTPPPPQKVEQPAAAGLLLLHRGGAAAEAARKGPWRTQVPRWVALSKTYQVGAWMCSGAQQPCNSLQGGALLQDMGSL